MDGQERAAMFDGPVVALGGFARDALLLQVAGDAARDRARARRQSRAAQGRRQSARPE